MHDMYRSISPMRTMLPDELEPGDTISPEPYEGKRIGPWDGAVVVKKTDTMVFLWRPYGVHAGFIYGSNPSVIPYIGIEEYPVERSRTSTRYFVWSRLALRCTKGECHNGMRCADQCDHRDCD